MKKSRNLILICLLTLYGCCNQNTMEHFENVQNEDRFIQGSGESLMEDKRESQELVVQNTEVIDDANTETAISAIVQNDITKIIITNGNTGEQKEINKIEEVDNLLNQIKNLNIISCEKNNVQGYAYSLAMYQEKELVQIIYVSSGLIQIGGKIYTVDSAENIIDSVK